MSDAVCRVALCPLVSFSLGLDIASGLELLLRLLPAVLPPLPVYILLLAPLLGIGNADGFTGGGGVSRARISRRALRKPLERVCGVDVGSEVVDDAGGLSYSPS